jgi:hypothetical protein
VRGDIDFYPSALEKGLRSERALKLALAEMYVKGISTRKGTDVLKAMCGLEISSSQVSRAAGELDGILTKTAPKLSAWLEANVPEALTVFSLPKHTGADSAPPTASNGSTRNSNEEPASPRSFHPSPIWSASSRHS